MSALTNTPQRLRQNTSECSYMQNANIFLSATEPCYIAASLVIFIWILHLHFLPLSVCVIVSNAGLDFSLRSDRGRLPLPAARFWGLPMWDWSFSFCLVSAKGQGGGDGLQRKRPPALCLRFPSVGKEGCHVHKITDWCVHMSAHKHHHHAWIKTHFLVEGWRWQRGVMHRLTDRQIVRCLAW